MHHPITTHQRPITLAVLIALAIALLPATLRTANADYPPGDPPETVKYGDTGILPGYELMIVNVDTDAEALLRAFDPSMGNISDTAWVMVQVEATYTGRFTGHPDEDVTFALHDDKGNSFDDASHSCERWPNPPERVSLEPGETARFNLCFTMPLRLMPEAELELGAYTKLMTDQWPVTFSLDKPGAKDDDVDIPCGCLPPTSTPNASDVAV